MRLKLTVVILLLSAVASCKNEKPPSGVMSQEKMVDWLLSVYLAESRAAALNISRDSVYKIFVPRQDTIMRQKGVTAEMLDQSYNYYLENPVKMEAVYDVVIDSLSLREQKLLSKMTPPSKP